MRSNELDDSISSSTIRTTSIVAPAVWNMSCATVETAGDSARAHGAEVLTARFESTNLLLRLNAGEVVSLLYAGGEAGAVAGNSR